MNSFIFVFCCVFGCSSSFAQQNLFNIPSGEITSKDDIFYQHQLNFYETNEVTSKQHFVYGLGGGFELGANVLDLPASNLSAIDDESRPLAALTLQKGWLLAQSLQLNIGTQIGTTFRSRNQNESLTGLNYALLIYRLTGHSRLVAGAYHAINDTFLKGSDTLGLLLGYELFITKRFGLMGDFISGKTESSVSVLGFIYSMTPHLQLCLGALLPNQGSNTRPGIVVELNAFTFKAF